MIDVPPAIIFEIPQAQAINVTRMLAAIATVENWKRGSVGLAGEIGPHQIKPAIWRQYSKVPQRTASTAEELRVATAHLHSLVIGLTALKLPANEPYWLALAWRCGLTNIEQHRVKPEWRDYAQRAENVYRMGR